MTGVLLAPIKDTCFKTGPIAQPCRGNALFSGIGKALKNGQFNHAAPQLSGLGAMCCINAPRCMGLVPWPRTVELIAFGQLFCFGYADITVLLVMTW
ncbi:MAG TPA: hypothetical protein VMJ11_01130 [Paraburkholderia sp.]|uniref:hypothetical protein n=1 Tax=Paraburkholderia sp. TaxID=1926495 RepID=UPI002C83D299|nr:hypothetical protein [Paraburkholderia sp.]HTR05278.1 hypothetical protein [Paraburkholderia sp.]